MISIWGYILNPAYQVKADSLRVSDACCGAKKLVAQLQEKAAMPQSAVKGITFTSHVALSALLEGRQMMLSEEDWKSYDSLCSDTHFATKSTR